MLTFDFETTNFSYGSALDARNYILMVCWQLDDGIMKRYSGDILAAEEFWDDVDASDVLCAYNKKFEQLWFLRCGIDIDRWVWHDPMLAEKILIANERKPLDLGSVAGRYGYDIKDPMIDKMLKAGVCPSEMPQKRLLARCARDVRTTAAILQQQKKLLTAQDSIHLYRNRCDFGDVLAHIENAGMQLDPDRVADEYAQQAIKVASLRVALDELTGGINLRSPDQLAHFVYGKLGFDERKGRDGKFLRNKPSKQFPKGRPKTDKDTLGMLKATTDEQRKFVDLRKQYGKANAALTKNLEFFYGVCEEYNCVFKAQFNQTVAATDRLTSSGSPLEFERYEGKKKSVQFQNMPRAYKSLFVAPEGYVAVEVDSAQLEFRVAAFLGQDKQAMQDILDPDFDAHCRSASVMNDIPYETFLRGYRGETTKTAAKKCKKLRTEAKPDTFKPLYGGTRGTPEQEKWYTEFNERYSGIYSQQEDWLRQVQQDGELVLPWGKRFRWTFKYNKRGVPLDAATNRPIRPQVFNYPVQSLATAEIVPIAITSLHKRCKRAMLHVKFVNTVHDSVICYVPIAELDEFKALAEQAFTKDVYEALSIFYGIEFNVPLGCEIVAGRHWGEGEEYVYDDVNNWSKQ